MYTHCIYYNSHNTVYVSLSSFNTHSRINKQCTHEQPFASTLMRFIKLPTPKIKFQRSLIYKRIVLLFSSAECGAHVSK